MTSRIRNVDLDAAIDSLRDHVTINTRDVASAYLATRPQHQAAEATVLAAASRRLAERFDQLAGPLRRRRR
jgi:hypothetical protein